MEDKVTEYSCLMSVYDAEKPQWLDESIKSILNQTVKPKQFVLVKDGPLTEELEEVINRYVSTNNDLFTIVSLEENIGLAKALNMGLKQCNCELVARMDSDDISLSNRCERQLEVFNTKDVDICGCAVDEFNQDPKDVIDRRIPPETEDEILRFAKKRNPFNHPTVMVKKQKVLEVGGYEDYPYFEDYNLWATMLNKGAKGYNIQDSLLKMRTGGGLYKRRGGVKYAKYMKSFKKHLKDIGFLSKKEYLISVSAHIVVSLIPTGLRKFIYKKMLRK